MSDYKPIEIRGFYRSPSHLPIWEVIDKAGIWEKLNIKMAGMEYCGSPPVAEGALFDGKIDFISGNHITPYALITKGKPIVCIASPSNGVRDKLVSRGCDRRGHRARRLPDSSTLLPLPGRARPRERAYPGQERSRS